MAVAHVVPLRDQVAHHVPGVDLDDYAHEPRPWLVVQSDPDDDPCVCAPTVELVPNDNGPDGWMYVHHSLDGREQHEHGGPRRMLPRWLALVLLGAVLILAGVFLAPLLPGTVGSFAYYVLLIAGIVAAVYGLAVLLLGHTRRAP